MHSSYHYVALRDTHAWPLMWRADLMRSRGNWPFKSCQGSMLEPTMNVDRISRLMCHATRRLSVLGGGCEPSLRCGAAVLAVAWHGFRWRSFARRSHGAGDGHRPGRFACQWQPAGRDRKSTRLNSSHVEISYAVFCL